MGWTREAGTSAGRLSGADRLGRRPALDGIRGLAIVGVLLQHTRVPGFEHAGLVGVTLFFVLSGFLISTLLLEEVARSGTVDFRSFYMRRARRLLPAIGALLLLSAIWLDWSGEGQAIVTGLLPIAFYVGNWASIAGVAQGGLGQTWSLAVEEQFYLVWPLVLLVLARRGGLRAVGLAALALAILSMVLRFVLAADIDRATAGTDTRMDALMVGVLLAVLFVSGRLPSIPRLMWVVGAIGLIAFLPASPAGPIIRYGFTVWALGSAVVVAAALSGRPAWVAAAPLRWLGRISYGVYVWHFPLAFAFRPTLDAWPEAQRILLAGVLIAASIGLGALSWHLIEARFQSRPNEHSDDRIATLEVHRVAG